MPFSLNQRSTPHNSFLDDVGQCVRAGYRGLGLDEIKLVPGSGVSYAQALEAVRTSKLQVTYVTPSVWPILASPIDPPGAPRDPWARIDAICASIERLSVFEPLGVVVGGGRSGDPERPAGPVEAIAEGVAQIADTAAEYGLRIGFELLSRRRGAPLSDLDELVSFIGALGRDNIGVMIDFVHCGPGTGVADALRRNAGRIDYVQVNDVREPERTWCDRLLPGDGAGVAGPAIEALLAGGYRGWFELEVFSDDGTFGTDLPDSLWKIPHEELLVRGKAAFERLYDEARERLKRRAPSTARTVRYRDKSV